MNNSYSKDTNLVLLFKSPQNSKRRLAEEIGDFATTAACLLWECALQDIKDWQGPSWFSPATFADHIWLNDRLGKDVHVIPQKTGNLGERINQVDQALRSKKISKIIYIGTDCPELNLDYIIDAATQHDKYDAIFGPALDGGVVLMGSRRPWPDLRKLQWSTDQLRDNLVNTCKLSGWTYSHLQTLSDIDSTKDLLAALTDLESTKRVTRKNLINWVTEHIDIIQGKKNL